MVGSSSVSQQGSKRENAAKMVTNMTESDATLHLQEKNHIHDATKHRLKTFKN